jgi:hypothetical protein
MEGNCYCCGKPGHKSKEEWAVNKAQQSHVQSQTPSDSASLASGAAGGTAAPPPGTALITTTGWAEAHINMLFQQHHEDMRWWILLDNQSSVSLFCNPNLVSNIRTSDTGDMLLSTNGGLLVTKNKADVPQWEEVWYNPKAITNIFSYICLKTE